MQVLEIPKLPTVRKDPERGDIVAIRLPDYLDNEVLYYIHTVQSNGCYTLSKGKAIKNGGLPVKPFLPLFSVQRSSFRIVYAKNTAKLKSKAIKDDFKRFIVCTQDILIK